MAAAKLSYDGVLSGLRRQEAELLERVAELSRQASQGQEHGALRAAELEAAAAALAAAQQGCAAAEADAADRAQRLAALEAEVRLSAWVLEGAAGRCMRTPACGGPPGLPCIVLFINCLWLALLAFHPFHPVQVEGLRAEVAAKEEALAAAAAAHAAEARRLAAQLAAAEAQIQVGCGCHLCVEEG